MGFNAFLLKEFFANEFNGYDYYTTNFFRVQQKGRLGKKIW
jgi:hypothetical protein